MKWMTSGQLALAGAALIFGLGLVSQGCVGDLFIGCEESATCLADHESCLDGYDNNGDGLADCADPECSPDYECADFAVPGGDWKLVTASRLDLSSADDAPCPDGSAPAVYYVEPSDAACAPCDCTLEGGACSAPQMKCYKENDCGGVATFTAASESTDCIPDSETGSLGSCIVTAPGFVTEQPSSCTFKGGSLSNPVPWGAKLHVCTLGAGSGGCSAGQACRFRDFDNLLNRCIIASGVKKECPAGWQGQKIDAFEGADDTRSCTPCGCNPEDAQCMEGSYTVFDWDGCGSKPQNGASYTDSKSLLYGVDCTPVPHFDSLTGSFEPFLSKIAPICTGGNAQGKVVTFGPHTICCH